MDSELRSFNLTPIRQQNCIIENKEFYIHFLKLNSVYSSDSLKFQSGELMKVYKDIHLICINPKI